MTFLPYWINSTLAALPATLWMVIGLGVPFTLAALPRRDWRDTPLVAMGALAFGPALLTAWMLLLGTLGGMNQTPMLTLPNILIGSLIFSLIGTALAWRKRSISLPAAPRRVPLETDERIILLMIAAALMIRGLATAYWNHTEYDPLWVYGYEGRLYALRGFIPTTIGYYPQFLPLQYTYTQLAAAFFTGQVIDDHAARAVIPFLHLGSILAAYTLGRQLFNRRVGIIMAGLWALYPHVAEWAKVGDLEIPLTFAFTGAAAFFLKAWLLDTESSGASGQEKQRSTRRYGALAGCFLGIALWTKPTAGAFILGVGLLTVLEMLRALRRRELPGRSGGQSRPGLYGLWNTSIEVIKSLARPLPDNRDSGGGVSGIFSARLEIVILTGLASIPLGGIWYIRNFLYGHEPITLPNKFWLTQALRSGAEFGFPILALVVVLLYLYLNRSLKLTRDRIRWWVILPGMILIAAALIPTIRVPYDPPGIPNRMNGLEWLLLLAGAVLIALELWRYASRHLTPASQWDALKIGWALALALPYFVTWFYSYSYHFRLSFAIVPLMMLPTAVILARWTPQFFAHTAPPRLRTLYPLLVLLICLPGVFLPLYSYNGGWDWLWSNEYPNDFKKLEATNLALAWTVKNLQDDIAASGLTPENTVIIAPGLQRLPFFFPLYDVRIDTAPTSLDQLTDADYYIYTQEAAWYYPEKGLPLQNQVTGSMGRTNVMQQFGGHQDSSFWSRLFHLREPERRFKEPRQLTQPSEPVQFGDFATFTGFRLTESVEKTPRTLQLVWQAIKPADQDYSVSVHLLDEQGKTIATWDGAPARGEYTYYAATLWQPGEYILDTRQLALPDNLAPGSYILRIGMYSLPDQQPLQVTVSGLPADSYTLPVTLTLP